MYTDIDDYIYILFILCILGYIATLCISHSAPGNGRGPGDGCPCPWVTEPKGRKMVGGFWSCFTQPENMGIKKQDVRRHFFPLIHWNKNRNSKFFYDYRSTRFIIKFHVNEVYEAVGENGRFHLRWRCRFVGATRLVKKRPFITTWECFFFFFFCHWFDNSLSSGVFRVYPTLKEWYWGMVYTMVYTQFGMVNGVSFFLVTQKWQSQSSGEIDRTLPTLPERSNYDILKQIPQNNSLQQETPTGYVLESICGWC